LNRIKGVDLNFEKAGYKALENIAQKVKENVIQELLENVQ
jgi:hypothetical protein